MTNIYGKLKKIEAERRDIDVTKYKPNRAAQDRVIREFNKGRSFSFNKWTPLTKYSNDDFEQDFVTYNNALLACKKSHESDEPPTLIYDPETNLITGVDSDVWDFVFASSIQYNKYYFDSLPEEMLGSGLSLESNSNKLFATAEAITTEPILVNVDLGTSFGKGDIIPPGTSIQDILLSVFSSTRLGRGDGLSIYTNSMLNAMPEEDRPESYIAIRDENELFETKDDRTYVEILFSAIRSLQAEVSKMKNAFKYGMYSYTGTDTALSEIVNDNVKEKEALWSVDESDLSEISEYSIDFEGSDFPFNPQTNIDISTKGVVRFNGNVTWEDYANELRDAEDPKLYLYMTTSDSNISINLTGHNSGNNFILPIDNFISSFVKKYNIAILVSRKYKNIDDENYFGFNYIWVSITNYETGRILAEGFYNPFTQSLVKDQYLLDDRYYISSILFNDLSLYKFNMYTKYQDFSQEVIPSIPNDSDYKYGVAHITIRSIDTYENLEKIYSKLPNNELIWEEANKRLWIKSNDSLVAIGGGSVNPGTGMTQTEVIELLQGMGIVYLDDTGVLQLSNIGDATFVNNDTGKSFKFEVTPDGDLKGTELPDKTLKQRIEDISGTNPISTNDSFRGFIARLLCAENGINGATASTDVGIHSDRVKIGSVYCPLTTDTKFGCSHGFVELENTSDSDIPLEGIYLHYLHTENNTTKVEHLPLKGILKAGSTYLIRCKQYADPKVNSDVFINVDSYDQEWYINKKLIDLSNDGVSAYAFALTYGNVDTDGSVISETTQFVTDTQNSNDKQRYHWKWYYIDSLILNKHYGDKTAYWGINVEQTKVKSNTIIKNTFELDPAKQAFQSLTTTDSSRRRTEKVNNDIQSLNLNNAEISFPNSDETYPVSRFTPKASKYKKNVSTDKTPLDMEKPNIVNCSFGVNAYTTRCFNWISAGQFDEYVFLKNTDKKWHKTKEWIEFESYKTCSEAVTMSTEYPRRKEFSEITNNAVYARINKTFPGCGIKYTAHKCIIELTDTPVDEKVTITYVVGRKDKNGNPDFEHCSDEKTFTIYPETYVPRIYQITDQQGFHWIEYQVWAAAAKALNKKIEEDCKNENIIPVLINTGDVTQNGTRINEWLDYHNGGKCLFDHLEQMNVVGNNDLCGTDPEILGTGDDVGKSNGFYFHVFHCYDIPDSGKTCPIIQTDDGEYKYIPSLYYFDFNNHRIVMVNSEITYVNCRDWFKKKKDGDVVNIYTGWAVEKNYGFRGDFTSIYTMLYNIFQEAGSKQIITACHEMPFTVITTDSLTTATKNNYRSYSGSGSSLIGSHMNQLNGTDKYGIYWFSRLLEHFKIKLCLGGHKHTYACTFPLKENYQYIDESGNLVESKTKQMTMEETLENDQSVTWIVDGTNLTKFPLISTSDYNLAHADHGTDGYIHPYTTVDGLQNGVTYFMCQATGYKLTSNKELPSNWQEFSNLIPKTDGSKADNSQKESMFAIINLNNGCEIALVKIKNIFAGYAFSQNTYATGTPWLSYAKPSLENGQLTRYCTWTEPEEEHIGNNIITL